MTVPVKESQIGEVIRAPAVLGNFMMDMEFLTIPQRLMANRTETVLLSEKRSLLTFFRGIAHPSLLPIVLQRRVVRGVILGHHPMSHDSRPGEFSECAAGFFIHEHPSVLTVFMGLAPIFRGSPSTRLRGMSAFHVAFCALIHEVIQVSKDFLGHAGSKVLAPSPNHRVERLDEPSGRRSHLLAPDPFQSPFELINGVLARFDQQFVTVARAVRGGVVADVKAEQVKSFGEMAQAGLVLRQLESSPFEPVRQSFLRFLGLFSGRAKHHQIVSVSYPGIVPRCLTSGGVANPQGVFHAV